MSAIIKDVAYMRASRKLEKYGIKIGQLLIPKPYSSGSDRHQDCIEFPFAVDTVDAVKTLEKQIKEYFEPQRFSVGLNSQNGHLRIITKEKEETDYDGLEIQFTPNVIIRPTHGDVFGNVAQIRIDDLLLLTNIGTSLIKYWTEHEKLPPDEAKKRLFEIASLGTKPEDIFCGSKI